MYNTEMYMNIYKKFGKDSEQLQRFKKYLAIYMNKSHIMERIYKTIMKETSSL